MPKIYVVDEKFLKTDIKSKISVINLYSEEFIRGYMHACYCLGAITKKTLNELKAYLGKKLEGGKI